MFNIYKKNLLLILMLSIASFLFAEDFTIKDFGAVADARTLNTVSIQDAINACAKEGGRVIIPAGTYLSGGIYLRSHVTLHLEPGAVLLGSTRLEDYEKHVAAYRSYADNYVERCLIYAEGETNIGISGTGTIDGNGSRDFFHTDRVTYLSRPFTIRMVSCSIVRITDVNMINSPMWMQQYQDCERLYIRGIRVYNHTNYNNDGLDIDGCREVIVSDCIIDSSDDGICLKSTGPAACENISITNCVVSSHVNAFKCGTESVGGFRNITISNCIVKPSEDRREPTLNGYIEGESGIALEIMDGGCMENIIINGMIIDSVRSPIFIKLGNRGRKYMEGIPRPGPGTIKNIRISNVTALNASVLCSSITGFPGHYVEDVWLSDIYLSSRGGGTHEDLMKEAEENETIYPWPGMFKTNLPAYGIYARHVKGLHLERIRFDLVSPDARPALHFEDVPGLTQNNITENK